MTKTTCIHQVYNPQKCPLLRSIKCKDCLHNKNSSAYKKMSEGQKLILKQRQDGSN